MTSDFVLVLGKREVFVTSDAGDALAHLRNMEGARLYWVTERGDVHEWQDGGGWQVFYRVHEQKWSDIQVLVDAAVGPVTIFLDDAIPINSGATLNMNLKKDTVVIVPPHGQFTVEDASGKLSDASVFVTGDTITTSKERLVKARYPREAMKTLSGRDASTLALLAQAPGLPEEERRRLARSLGGDARQIARALGGEKVCRWATAAADEFRRWAEGLDPPAGGGTAR